MDQSRESEKFDAAKVFERIKMQDPDKGRRGTTDDEDSPTRYWDESNEQQGDKPEYDSRASS